MKVEQLIGILKDLPADADVLVQNKNWDCSETLTEWVFVRKTGSNGQSTSSLILNTSDV